MFPLTNKCDNNACESNWGHVVPYTDCEDRGDMTDPMKKDQTYIEMDIDKKMNNDEGISTRRWRYGWT